MAEKKRPAKKDGVTPSIVINRSLMQQPMAAATEPADSADSGAIKLEVKTSKPILKPSVVKELKTEPPAITAPAADKAPEDLKDVEGEEAAEADKQAEHDAAIQKLIVDKQFVLPINSVEKRKTKRFIILGVGLSLVLAVAWADVALDAGIIHLGSVKPVTHFFSN
jgi:hypothetical protein